MDVFSKLLAQVQDSPSTGGGGGGGRVGVKNAPTEQDILANLLGEKIHKMKIVDGPQALPPPVQAHQTNYGTAARRSILFHEFVKATRWKTNATGLQEQTSGFGLVSERQTAIQRH